VAWALVSKIPRKALVPGVAMIALGVGIGFGVHTGLSVLQGNVEEWSTEMLQDYFAAKPDAFKERTRIGDIGRIKLSDRILMRVVPEGRRPASMYLREAAFDRYYNGEWQAARRAFKPVQHEGERWKLRDGADGHIVTVRRSIPGGEGLLPLPPGARFVDRLPAEALEVLPTGTVRARGVPRFVSLAVAYDEGLESEPPFDDSDLDVSTLIAPVLDEVLKGEQLLKATPAETLAAVERYFAQKYSYSLNLSEGKDGNVRTIVDFLLRDHKGHCEYFATGTALLLRRAGIPARYTVGYSAQEYSDLERAFIVRNRHAHAWTTAYIGGRWVTVDTTPARWADNEAEAARGLFGPMLDVGSWMLEYLVQAWLTRSASELVIVTAMVIGFLVLAPFSYLFARRWRRRPRIASGPVSPVTRAWQTLEKRLAGEGFTRERGETALEWARRLRRENQFEPWRRELVQLAQAYYRARFDPSSSEHARNSFIREARQWRSGA
jgi:transglutaminase-like putative cysteine protease